MTFVGLKMASTSFVEGLDQVLEVEIIEFHNVHPFLLIVDVKMTLNRTVNQVDVQIHKLDYDIIGYV